MKLRLTEPGFLTYTGQMGVVNFVDGLSVEDVLPIDGVRISAAIGAQWEDGSPSNVGEMYISSMNMPAHVGAFDPTAPAENFKTFDESGAEMPPAVGQKAEQGEQTSPEAAAADQQYTAESLAKIADESGIAGLRAVGDKLGVKGKSINELIELILKAQTVTQPE